MKQHQIQSSLWAKPLVAVFIGLLLAAIVPNSHAAEIIWNGAGDGTTMSSGANWVGGTAPVAGADSIVFAGTTGLSVNNDIITSGGSAFGGITFSNNAGAFTINGNSIFLSGGITNNSTSLQYFVAKADLNSATRVINAAAGPMQFDLMGSTGSPLLFKDGTNTVYLTGTLDNPGLLCTVTNGVLVLAKGGLGASVHALGGSTVFNVWTNGTLRFGPSTNEQQIFRNSSIRLEGGTLQVQTTLTNIQILNAITGTNSSTSVVENGLANTTNTLSLGANGGKRAIYSGKIQDGAAAGNVLNLAITPTSIYQFDGALTYSGTTTISGPSATVFSRLIINGSHIGAGAYSLFGNNGTVGAALNGRGLISATVINVYSNAIVGPGGGLNFNAAAYADSVGMLTLSNTVLNLNSTNSTLDVLLNGTAPGTGYDQLAMVGSGSFSNNTANLKFAVNPSFIPATGDKFTIVRVPGTNSANNVGVFGSLNGVPTDLSQGAQFIDTGSGKAFKISYRAEGSTFDMGSTNGNDIMLQVQSTPGEQITWRGDVNNAWDVLTTQNWRSNGIPNVPRAFGGTDNVTFDDSGSNSVPIDLTTGLSPLNIAVNATNNYVFATSTIGKLTGGVVLIKTNTGTLSMVTDNDNTGSTIIQRGTVQVGTNGITGTVSGSVVVNPNGIFAFNHSDPKVFSTVAFSGTGGFVHNGDGQLTITADMSDPNPSSGFTGNTTNTGGLLQFGDGSGAVGQIGGTVYVPLTNVVDYLFSINANINNALGGSGTVDFQSVNGGTLTFASTAVSSNFTGTANIAGGVRVHAVSGNLGYAFGNGSTVNVPAFSQAWCDTSGTTYNNIFNIAGTGWTGTGWTPAQQAANPGGTGAISVFNCTFNGLINLLADARISGTIAGGTILCPITGPYQLEIWGNLGSYVLNMGPTNGTHSYSSTLITSGTVRALNTGAISTGPLTMDLAADLRLNGNNVAVASLISINSGQVVGSGATIQNTGPAVATLTVGSDNSSTVFDGIFVDGGSGALGLTKVGAGALTLSGVSTNTGTVTVNGGTLAMTGLGSFGKAAKVIVGSGAFYDLSGVGGTLTLNSGQTLGGNGTVTGNVIASSGSTIAPGTSVGTLTVAGNVTLGGGMTMELNRTLSPNSDRLLTSGGSITSSGGTLTTTNIGLALQVGNTFQLFASGVSGITANLQTVDALNGVTYTWQNNIGSSGSITVQSVTPIAVPLLNFSRTGNNLNFSWTGPFKLQSQTNSLNTGLSGNWGDYPGGGTSPVNVTINPANPTVFFRLTVQ